MIYKHRAGFFKPLKRWMTKRGITIKDEMGKYNDRTEWSTWQTLFDYTQEKAEEL